MSRQRNVRKSTITSRLQPAPPSQPKRIGEAAISPSTSTNRSNRTRSIFQKPPTSPQAEKIKSSTANGNVENILTASLPRRPPSSLSKFRVLPNIPSENSWTDDEIDVMTNEAQQMILDSSMQPRVELVRFEEQVSPRSPKADKRKNISVNRLQSTSTSSPQRKKTKLSNTNPFAKKQTNITASKEHTKPKQSQNVKHEQLTIALKLPDGRRIEKLFWSSDYVQDVMEYVESEGEQKLEDLNIYTMQSVPKVLLSNWNLSLQTLGIKDRTVLYIEEKDE